MQAPGVRGRIHHRHSARTLSGLDNVVADALSRPPAVADTIAAVPATGVPLKMVMDRREMARAQGTCMETLQATKSPSLQLLEQEVEGASLLGDISRGFGDLSCLPATGELFLRRATTWLILAQGLHAGSWQQDLCGQE
jgi:hypothetical protein